MDLYTTFIKIGGGHLPDYKIDGLDVTPFLTAEAEHSPRKEFGYFINKCQGIRVEEWKLRELAGKTELFNLQYDPGERYNQADRHPEIVKRLRERMKALADDVGVGLAD